ncbi:MAG: outer membrane beta-barrel protein [Candidatus Margulisiibacteriota bacterium]
MRGPIKYYLLFLIIILFCGAIEAQPRINTGVNMGAFEPDTDSLAMGSFGRDFTFSGYVGIQAESGIEFRADLGSWGTTSHHPDDLGNDLVIGIIPLKASLIYNFSPEEDISPYLGAGVGVYFYNLRDRVYGELEKGTVFGQNIVAGIKFHFTDYLYVTTQYEKHFLPKIFFNNSHNFDSSAFTIGMGIATNFVKVNGYNLAQTGGYRYSREQETLLVDIQQIRGEIDEMNIKLNEIEAEMDLFYNSPFMENDPDFKRQFEKVKYLETKQARVDTQKTAAQTRLDTLRGQWVQLGVDSQTIQEHIVYLENYYPNSPYGLNYRDGYFTYREPYRHQYYHNDDAYNYPATPASGSTSMSQEEREEYLKKRREYLAEKKNRTK